jgi:ribosomal protein L32E
MAFAHPLGRLVSEGAAWGLEMSNEQPRYCAFTDAESGKTIYVNPTAVRFVVPAGHRTMLVFSEAHAVTVTADLQSVIEGGLFEVF